MVKSWGCSIFHTKEIMPWAVLLYPKGLWSLLWPEERLSWFPHGPASPGGCFLLGDCVESQGWSWGSWPPGFSQVDSGLAPCPQNFSATVTPKLQSGLVPAMLSHWCRPELGSPTNPGMRLQSLRNGLIVFTQRLSSTTRSHMTDSSERVPVWTYSSEDTAFPEAGAGTTGDTVLVFHGHCNKSSPDGLKQQKFVLS